MVIREHLSRSDIYAESRVTALNHLGEYEERVLKGREAAGAEREPREGADSHDCSVTKPAGRPSTVSQDTSRLGLSEAQTQLC